MAAATTATATVTIRDDDDASGGWKTDVSLPGVSLARLLACSAGRPDGWLAGKLARRQASSSCAPARRPAASAHAPSLARKSASLAGSLLLRDLHWPAGRRLLAHPQSDPQPSGRRPDRWRSLPVAGRHGSRRRRQDHRLHCSTRTSGAALVVVVIISGRRGVILASATNFPLALTRDETRRRQ